MKERVNKIIDIVGLIFLCIITILLNIYIGTNLQEPIYIIRMISMVFGTIYTITKIVVDKENVFIKGKIDICVLLLVVSTAIPLIFKTYSSYNETINTIMNYLAVYLIYIVTRNVVINEKKIKTILNVIIISSIIPIVLAIDYQYFNRMSFVFDFINVPRIIEKRGRMLGTFGYPNTLALYLTFNLFNAIQLFKQSKKTKILYIIYIISSIGCIVLTMSKAVIGLTIIIFILKFIINHKNKILNKKVIIISLVVLFSIVLVVFILLQFSEPLRISCDVNGFEDENLYNLKSGEEYEFAFDIRATSRKIDAFTIEIVEINNYESETVLGTVTFHTFEGRKTIPITPSSKMKQIKIKFYNKFSQDFVIENMFINGKKHILKYKFVPDKLKYFFNTYSINNKSIRQRLYFYFDSLKILEDKWIFGGGGKTWYYNYQKVQEYNYYSKESHSYLLDVWMNFGIIGIGAFLSIIIITIYNIYKKIKKEKRLSHLLETIITGTLLIIIHSFIDFDLSFLIMLVVLFMMLAIINQKDKAIKDNLKIAELCIIGVLIYLTIFSINELYIYKIKKLKNEGDFLNLGIYKTEFLFSEIKETVKIKERREIQSKKLFEQLEQYISLEPEKNKLYVNNVYCSEIANLVEENYIPYDQIEYIINYWSNNKNKKFDFGLQLKILENMKMLINVLNINYLKTNNMHLRKYADAIENIFKKEYDIYFHRLDEMEKNNTDIKTIQYFKENYFKIFNAV